MRLPAGVRDWLPHELARKRALEATIRGVFERWRYAEVMTPGFERFDVIEAGLGEELTEKTFRFSDRRANTLALRPEMTTPIARLVSTRMRGEKLPLRLSYVAPAYRFEQPQQGRMQEFTQAGVELIGARGVEADSEMLLMALETLDAIGLNDARFDINDAAIVDGVLDGLGIHGDAAHRCKILIAERNIAALRAQFPAEVAELAMLRGDEHVFATVRRLCRTPRSLEALDRLHAIRGRAIERGYGERVAIDFALLRDLEYYTGFVFEGYVRELGYAVCGGGRYDTLLPRMGFDAPAVGWAGGPPIHLRRLDDRDSEGAPLRGVGAALARRRARRPGRSRTPARYRDGRPKEPVSLPAPDRRPGLCRVRCSGLRDRRCGCAVGSRSVRQRARRSGVRLVPARRRRAARGRLSRGRSAPDVFARRDEIHAFGRSLFLRTRSPGRDHLAARLGRAEPPRRSGRSHRRPRRDREDAARARPGRRRRDRTVDGSLRRQSDPFSYEVRRVEDAARKSPGICRGGEVSLKWV